MKRPWYKAYFGNFDADVVRSLAVSCCGGDRYRAYAYWQLFMEYVSMHSPKHGTIRVTGLEDLGERLLAGDRSKKAIKRQLGDFLIQYRDEHGRAILTYDKDTGIVQMQRWGDTTGESESAPRVRKHRTKGAAGDSSDPPDSKCNVTSSLSLSSSGSSPDSEEEDAAWKLPDSMFERFKPEDAERVRAAWRAWYSARSEEHGPPASASVLRLRMDIASKMGDYGPGFVVWALGKAASGAYKTPAWDVAQWRRESGKNPYTATNNKPRKNGLVH